MELLPPFIPANADSYLSFEKLSLSRLTLSVPPDYWSLGFIVPIFCSYCIAGPVRMLFVTAMSILLSFFGPTVAVLCMV